MKISIITIQYAHNYGAVLQAFSLKKFLEIKGHQVTVVNYVPPREKRKYSLKLKNSLGKKEAITKLKILEWFRNEIDVKRAQPEWEVRYNNFNDFIEKMLTLGKSEVTDVEALEKDADAFLRDASDSTALGGKTFTLVTTTERLDGNDALRDFVYSSGTVTYSGPYCVVTSMPVKHPVK